MSVLSVVIPALNEAQALPALLGDLERQQGCELQVIVADGGSADGTVEAAAGRATLVRSKAGRGAQMNAGAARATGSHLLFLHADSRITDDRLLRKAVDALEAECEARGHARVAGHFALRFDRSRQGHEPLFRLLEQKSALNRPGTINGDQALLLRRGFFDELGGFDESRAFLEDQRIAARIFERGHWMLLPGHLHTSARRFEAEGPRERLALMALLMGAYATDFNEFLDSAPDIYRTQDRATRLRLAPFYRHCRQTLRSQGVRGMARTLFRAGRYVRRNCWQLFWWRDHRRNPHASSREHPSLDFFDRRVEALIDNRGTDALAAVLVALWLFAWLPVTENQEP